MGRTKQVSDDAVLEAARSVFVEQGFGGSTREIARRVGISESAIFQRFKTKVDLFLGAMVPPALEPPPEPSGRGVIDELSALALGAMTYFRGAMPVFLQLVTHPSFNLADLADRERRMPLNRLSEAVSACLERYRASGALTADPHQLQAATLTLIATVHSLALFEHMGVHGGSFPDRAVRSVVQVIVTGLGSKEQKGRKR